MDDETYVRVSQEALPMLWRLSMSILHHRSDAEDAVQQGMLRAWEHRAKGRPGCERAWMTRIIINECRNIQRRRMREEPREAMAEEPAWVPPDTALRDALEVLPEKYRLPLLLKYMEGMTEREAAEALNMTVTGLKSRLMRARHALAEALQEEVAWNEH